MESSTLEDMERREQRIEVDENLKVTIISNSPHIIGGIEEFEGKFYIKADDLVKILPILDHEMAGIHTEPSRKAYEADFISAYDVLRKNYYIPVTKANEELIEINRQLTKKLSDSEKLSQERYDGREEYLKAANVLSDIINKLPSFIKKIFISKNDMKFVKRYTR